MDVCQKETEYSWLDAAKVYEQKVESESPSGILAGESWQRIGYCYDLASRQVNDIEDFKSLRDFGLRAYERAAEFYLKENKGKANFCLAVAEYLRSWLASDSSEKKENLDLSFGIAKKALLSFKKSKDDLSYGQTVNVILKVLYDRMSIAFTSVEKNKISEEAIDFAKEAISFLSKVDNKEELLVAFSLASIHFWYASNINEDEKIREDFSNKSLNCADNAIKLAKDIENPYLFAISRWAAVYSYLYFKDDIEISMRFASEMLEKASFVNDNYLIGIASFLCANVAYLNVECEADPNKRKSLNESIVKFSEQGIRHLNLVFHDSLIAECYEYVSQTYCDLASVYANSRSEKIVYSEKALNFGKMGLEYAVRSGTPESMLTVFHALGKVYYYRSNLELRKNRKIDFLKSALDYRRKHVDTAKHVFPSNTWIQGVSKAYAGQIQRDLSRLETEQKIRIDILKKAISDLDDGVTDCRKWIESCDVPSVVAILARFEDSLGGTLVENYSLTDEIDSLDRANQVYSGAAEGYKKVDLPSRVAESYWKIARNLDGVSSYDKAAKYFEYAFAAYKAAAKKLREFSEFYIDYAYYMKAWSEIEFAKGAHNSEDYKVAMSQYEKASRLLRKSKSWMYLAQNFYALSVLEKAEDYSRKEKPKKAIEAFENALKYLQESKRILGVKLEGLENGDEKDVVNRLVQTSDIRMKYCQGRISVEEAKIFDRKGQQIKSSEEYKKAAGIFQELALIDKGQIGREAKPLSYLCQAWEKMTTAEARVSPIMYEEAAELFKLAKDYSVRESSGLMAIGHSSFCKALEAGTEFELTHSNTMYEEATRFLGVAADSYLKAGFKKASDYAMGIQGLFDAYFFMVRAKRERDNEKQLKHYSMAEEVLEKAVEYFEKAKVLDKAKEAKDLLQ